MRLLAESFTMFTYAGIWRPIYWHSKSARATMYMLYTFFSIGLVYTLTISELMGALLLTNSLEDFTDISFLLISTINVCCKTTNVIFRRNRIIDLANMLINDYCLPGNNNEIKVLEKYARITRYTAWSCLVLAGMTVAVMSLGPLIQSKENRTLPFKSWLPFEFTSTSIFWLSYVHQTVAIVLCATINVANDTLICGFMLYACSQLELLSQRLIGLPQKVKLETISKKTGRLIKMSESQIISQHIGHHIHVFKYAENINLIFTPVILLQFCMSGIVLSLSIYQLSARSTTGIQFLTMIMYLCCMLVEFFMYCWFGNEVTLKSVDFAQAIYEIEWTSLSTQTNKQLILMMLRAKKPVVISCGSIITLSIKSFTTILKVSYSAFNVLQTSSQK